MLRFGFLLALILLGCCACVGSRDGLLPELDRDEILLGERLPAISYSIETAGNLGSLPRYEVEKLFRDAFVDARRGPAADDLHVELCFRVYEEHHARAIGLRCLSALSLMLIPSYSRRDVSLGARVVFERRLVREYLYEDNLTVWGQVLLLPWSYTSHNAFRVQDAQQSNLVLHLLRDLRHDLPQLVPGTHAGKPAG